jgi:hypothetical protein
MNPNETEVNLMTVKLIRVSRKEAMQLPFIHFITKELAGKIKFRVAVTELGRESGPFFLVEIVGNPVGMNLFWLTWSAVATRVHKSEDDTHWVIELPNGNVDVPWAVLT